SFNYNIKYGSYRRHSAYTQRIDRQSVAWGPLITWKGKTSLCPQDNLSFSWGANAALMFIGHRSLEINGNLVRSRQITSPQLGIYGGVTWQMPDSPLSFTAGYRGEAFFNLYDAGKFNLEHPASRFVHGPFLEAGYQF